MTTNTFRMMNKFKPYYPKINPLLTKALEYANASYKIIPIKSKGKSPIISNWPENASADTNQITQWWTNTPNANIGIVTGKINNFYVLDIDDDGDVKTGNASLKKLEDVHGKLPDTLAATTGSGGKHYCFKYSGNKKLGNKIGVVDYIDFKGNKGQIVAAPSIHKTGGVYSWDNDNPLAEIPEWLVKLILNKTVKDKSTGQTNRKGVEGYRNDDLTSIAGSLRRNGLHEQQIFDKLREHNNTFDQPLAESEVRTIANGICNYPRGNQTEQKRELAKIDGDNGYEFLDNLFEECKQRDANKLLGWPLNKFKQLAKNIDGIQQGLYLIPGEAGAGKTMFLINLFLDIIQTNENISGYYISLDDPKSVILHRSMACLSGVSINNVQKLKGSISNQNKVSDAKNTLSDLFQSKRMNLFDIGKVKHINQLKTLADKVSSENKKFFIVIDGVYNLGVGNHGEARNENIKRANYLKELSDVYNIPLICTAEVRKDDGRSKVARVLSNNDIMESGKYIFNANSIWMLAKILNNRGVFMNQLKLYCTKNKLSYDNVTQTLNINTNNCSITENSPNLYI